MYQKYVISGDIQRLLQNQWNLENKFHLPSGSFFSILRKEFTTLFTKVFGKSFVFIDEQELTHGLREKAQQSVLPVVSLDKTYHESYPALELTRLIDEEGNDSGIGERHNATPFIQQLQYIRSRLGTKVALLDDVVYNGDSMQYVIEKLNTCGIQVPTVFAGIGIERGIERLKEQGTEVQCIFKFSSLIDEVCERDFYPGVPLCGRTLAKKRHIGVPYILPFGNPGAWASIPVTHQIELSILCIELTIKLFDEVGKISGTSVLCRDLNRGIIHIPHDNTTVVDALQAFLPKK